MVHPYGASQSRAQASLSSVNRPLRKIPSPMSEGHSTNPTDHKSFSKMKVSELFACNVFSLALMEKTLPKAVFKKLADQMAGHGAIDKETADAVAHAVKVWAMDKGATHFTHWFQPQNNATAEKHDSFLTLKYGNSHSNLTVPHFLFCSCHFPF